MYNLPANGVGNTGITGTNYTMAAPLYNGNIASMMVSIPRLSNSGGTNGAGQMVYGFPPSFVSHEAAVSPLGAST